MHKVWAEQHWVRAGVCCRHFQNDLTETRQHIMDPHKLKEAVVLLLQRHGGTGGGPSLLAQDVQAEFDRYEPDASLAVPGVIIANQATCLPASHDP